MGRCGPATAGLRIHHYHNAAAVLLSESMPWQLGAGSADAGG